jgi:hypothetical protein
LSPGNDYDAPAGGALLEELDAIPKGLPMLMDRAYDGDETRQPVFDLGMIPVVAPNLKRLTQWKCNRAFCAEPVSPTRINSVPPSSP